MFKSPFGSIFEGGLPKSYLGQPDANQMEIEEVVKGEDHAIKAKAQGAPSGRVSAEMALPEMRSIEKEMQDSEEITPSSSPRQTRETLKTKTAFSVLPPQFRAATSMRSEDPKVQAEQAKILVDKRKRQLTAVQKEIGQMQQKINGARLYRDVLGQYSQLQGADKEALDGWIDIHEKAIQQLNSAQKLKKTAAHTREAAASINSEIKHWEALKDLKAKGVDVKGKTILKNFRPSAKAVKASPKPKGPVPKFKGRVPVEDIVRLTQSKAKSEHVQGLAATDEAVQSLSKQKPQKGYKEIFMEQLPSRNLVLQQREAKGAEARLIKRTEKTMIRAKTLEWEIGNQQDLLTQLENKFRNAQEAISDIVQSIGTDPQSKKSITALGILVEAKPERFVGATTLLNASMDAFKRLSNLGQEGKLAAQPTPEQEAEAILQEAAAESAAAIADLETKQHALDTVQADVEDKTPPPPLQVSVVLVPPPPAKPAGGRRAVGFLNKLLPWIAVFLIIRALMGKGA